MNKDSKLKIKVSTPLDSKQIGFEASTHVVEVLTHEDSVQT